MCYETTKLITEQLSLDKKNYSVTFQSRLDDKWLKPYTAKELIKLAKNGKSKILIVSPAFVSDCLETIIEISQINKAEFIKIGGKELSLVPSLNDSDDWVDAVMDIIKSHG